MHQVDNHALRAYHYTMIALIYAILKSRCPHSTILRHIVRCSVVHDMRKRIYWLNFNLSLNHETKYRHNKCVF